MTTTRQIIPTLPEHGPHTIVGAWTVRGFTGWDDFTAYAVAGICFRIKAEMNEDTIGREVRNRQRAKASGTCPHDGCLLIHPGEPCPSCATRRNDA